MELTKADIYDINDKAPRDQGVFKQPYGIPVHIKELVVYMRYESGGMRGGSYKGTDNVQRYTNNDRPKFKVLDLVLRKLKPDISFLDFRELETLIHKNDETEREYYGNSTDWNIEYIILPELIDFLKKL